MASLTSLWEAGVNVMVTPMCVYQVTLRTPPAGASVCVNMAPWVTTVKHVYQITGIEDGREQLHKMPTLVSVSLKDYFY